MKPIIYTRGQALPGILAQRIAILDGAMGTMKLMVLAPQVLPDYVLPG